MSNTARVPEELSVGRSDPAYMAHAYLTKVPVPAIMPFIEAYSRPGDVIVDPFAGSGMTGVAAAMYGRSAKLFDISVLGQHIGSNYVNLVNPRQFDKHAQEAVEASRKDLGDLYQVTCSRCHSPAELAKAVWSFVVECRGCKGRVNYYRCLESAEWSKPEMACPHCQSPVSSRDKRVGEEQVLDYIVCSCSPTQIEQEPQAPPSIDLDSLGYPRVEITPDRQMYKASALGKSGMTSIASYYSGRNLAVLTTLHRRIGEIEDRKIRSKLLFAFTACLTRASKRYQWSKARPLNAANANYYVASVFYEWNVYELFLRKVSAIIKSDEWILATRRLYAGVEEAEYPQVSYETSSADKIPLPDESVDYVFTDPPFGSNLFYADMAIFQEAWLDGFSDVQREAVVDRRGTKGARTADRYEQMLSQALAECRRILKPGGKISMVFGNSSGEVWALVQRAILSAGLRIIPDALVVLNKGQRSVKGLASGFEHVATLDLVITMEPATEKQEPGSLRHVDAPLVGARIREIAEANPASPSHLYLELLRTGIREGWRLEEIDLSVVTTALLEDGWTVEPKSGRLRRGDGES
ncbi:DNA methyltransferase [Streptomyces violaceusniger]|uniref:DNA methyltransferase n=1 Tax=Streptomyces violaceusniger TaxID=68280 RepID=UPI0038277872